MTARVGCGPVLTNDKDWYTSNKREMLIAGLGGLHYAITTKSESAQRYFDQGLVLHALQQGGHGVWIAAHGVSQLALGESDGIPLEQGAQNRELVGRDFQLREPAAEGLVQAVPRAAQQGRQAPAFRRVDRQRAGWAVCF